MQSVDEESLTKLGFTIEASTEESAYPAQELLYQSQETRGWQSAKSTSCTGAVERELLRYAGYPQELLMRFESCVRLKQIQILCHEYKICSRMEIWIGRFLEGEAEDDVDWKRLGSLAFDPNERSGFLARELKSVHVTAEGDLLKMRFLDCHKNKLNKHNQIGVVALNLMGHPLDLVPSVEAPVGEVSAKQRTEISGFDTVTLNQFQKLQRMKEAAVQNEDYDAAKQLKFQIEALRSLGSRLAKLEAQKRAAVEQEDYDLAKQLKEEIRQIRESASTDPDRAHAAVEQIPLPDAFSRRRSLPAPDANTENNDPFSDIPAISGVEDSRKDASAEVSPSVGDAFRSPSFGRSKHEEYDERVAQANGKYDGDAETPEPTSVIEDSPKPLSNAPEGFPRDLPNPEPITAANAKSAQPLEQLAGEYIAQCFYSRNWQLREAALIYLQSHLDSLVQPGQEREHFRLLCVVTAKGLKDKVPNVFLTSASLIRSLVTDPATHPKDLQFATSDFVPLLVEKLGETNPRIRDAAQESILTLADLKESGLKNLTALFLQPSKKPSAWRPILGRLEVISELVDRLGVGKGGGAGFDLDQLMSFVAKACTSANADVRGAAVRLTALVANRVGPHVKRYIPNDVNPKVREQLDQEIAASVNSSPTSQPSPKSAPKSNPKTPTSSGSPISPGSLTLPSDVEDPVVYAAELEKQEAVLGDDHPDLVEVLTNLAAAYTQREEFDKAYPLLKRVLDINERHFGEDHSNVAHALTDLAVLHMEQGQDDEGRPLLERALAIQERNLGSDHPDVVAIRDVLATETDA